MTDPFVNHPPALTAPGSRHYAITPSDSANETEAFRSVYVGGAGNVAIVDLNGDAVTWTAAAAGSILPMRGIRVNSTNTTATNLVGII